MCIPVRQVWILFLYCSHRPLRGSGMSSLSQHGHSGASPTKYTQKSWAHRQSETVQLNPSSIPQQKCQCAAYSECVNAGVEVVGEGVCLEKRVVRDGAEWEIFATQFLLQLQGLLETSLFVWRLSTRVKKCSVSSICGLQTPFLQLENAQNKHLNA